MNRLHLPDWLRDPTKARLESNEDYCELEQDAIIAGRALARQFPHQSDESTGLDPEDTRD